MAKLDAGNESREYKVKTIQDSAVYAKKSAGYLPGLYCLILWKNYPKEENIWEPSLTTQYLKKLISSNHPDKPTAISEVIDSTSQMVKSTIKLAAKTATRPPK